MKSAFVFPGQGSQSVGMLQALESKFNIISQTFSDANAVLGYDAWQLAATGPSEQLDNTLYTQPILLAASISLWNLWRQEDGFKPNFLAGHSLGEYSALVASGAMTYRDAIKLVQTRAQCMQQAVPEGVGSMAAILGLDDAQVVEACSEAAQSQVVSAVNFNSPGQVVIAGHKEAVDRAIILAKAKGAKRALPLAVSVPSHCALMKNAAIEFAEHLNSIEIKSPEIPVIHNVDANTHSHPDDIRAALAAQLYKPVQWTQSIQLLASEGVTYCVECGPGKVLTGLIKRIDKSLITANLHDEESIQQAFEFS